MPDRIRLPRRLKPWFEPDAFAAVRTMAGQTFREHKHRRTYRVCLDGRAHFIKYHGPTAWAEILKHAGRGRWPTLTADPERRAAAALRRLGVATVRVRGFGRRNTSPGGWNPARFESFLVMESLEGTRPLDEVLADLNADAPANDPSAIRFRRRLADIVADMTRVMHEHGMNHRDLYLEHFRIDESDAAGQVTNPRIWLIDLHRVQIRRRVPTRWAAKDLAALLFSSIDLVDNHRDLLRFIERYAGRPWREELLERPGFWRRVVRRAGAMYRRDHGRAMPALAVPGGSGTLPRLWLGHAKSRSG